MLYVQDFQIKPLNDVVSLTRKCGNFVRFLIAKRALTLTTSLEIHNVLNLNSVDGLSNTITCLIELIVHGYCLIILYIIHYFNRTASLWILM